MYIADTANNRIRKVTVSTGIITTIAGNGGSGSYSGDNCLATSASLYYPYGISVDTSGTSQIYLHISLCIWQFLSYLGNLYISDTYNSRIRKVTISTGIITTIAGTGTSSYSGDNGAATSATLYNPYGVALDASGRIL